MSLTEERDALAQQPLVLGRYRLGRRLGAGGFGAVHEAFDERLERWVAVKVIPAAKRRRPRPDRAPRARRVAAAAASTTPGSSPSTTRASRTTSRYLVCELVEGPTMAQLEAADALTDRDVLRIGLALCDALEHAHDRGVVHRDVKPQNVLVPDQPRTWRGAAKLTDFGVALLAGDDPLTRTGDVVGTLAYMAPEQAAGKRVDERADLYAARAGPLRGAGRRTTRSAAPPPPRRRGGWAPRCRRLAAARPDLPEELTAALDRALHPDPDERGTLAELGDALEEALVERPRRRRHDRPASRRGPDLPAARPARRAADRPRAGHRRARGRRLRPAGLGRPNVPWPAAAGAAALVAVLPRFGWLVTVAAAIAALVAGPAALQGDDGVAAAGSAALLVLAALPIPCRCSRARRAPGRSPPSPRCWGRSASPARSPPWRAAPRGCSPGSRSARSAPGGCCSRSR